MSGFYWHKTSDTATELICKKCNTYHVCVWRNANADKPFTHVVDFLFYCGTMSPLPDDVAGAYYTIGMPSDKELADLKQIMEECCGSV